MIGNKRLVSSRGTAASNCVKKKTQAVPHSIGKSAESKTKENSKTLKRTNDFNNKTNASSLRQSSPVKLQCQQTISSAAKITPRPNAAAKNQGNLPSGFSNNLNTKQSSNRKTATVNTLAKNPRSLPALNSRSVSKPPSVPFANKLGTSTNKIKPTHLKLNSRPQMPSVHPVAFIKDESKKFRQKTRDQFKLSVPNTIQEEDSKITVSLDQNNLSTASPNNKLNIVSSTEICCPKICVDTNISDSTKKEDNFNALSSVDVLLQDPTKHLQSNEKSPLINSSSVRHDLCAEVLEDKSKVLGLNINNKVHAETGLGLNDKVSLTYSEMESQNLCVDCSNANENDKRDGVGNSFKENNQSLSSNIKYGNCDLLLNPEYFRKEEFNSVDTTIEHREYTYTSERQNFRLNDDPYEGISCAPTLNSEDLKPKVYSDVPDKLHLCAGGDKLINKKSAVSDQIAADKVENVTDEYVQRSYTKETYYENTVVLPEKLIDDIPKNSNEIVDSATLINIRSNEFDILEINVEIGKKVDKVHDVNENDGCSNFVRENEIENMSEFDGKTFIWTPSKIARFKKSHRVLAEEESSSPGRNNVYSDSFEPGNDKNRIYRDIPCDQSPLLDHSDEMPEPKCAEYRIDSSLTINDNCETQFDESEDDIVWIPSPATDCTAIESKLEGIRRISESHNVRISDKLFISNEIGYKITTDVMISKKDFVETTDTSYDCGFELASLNISEPTVANSCETFEDDEQASEQENYFQGVDTLALLDFSSNELEKDDENCFDQSILALFPEDVVFCQGGKELYHCQTLAKDNDDDCAFESEEVSETIDTWNSVWVDYKTPIKDNVTEPSGENVSDVWIIDENSCDDQPQNSDTIVLLDSDDNDWIATKKNLDELRNCLDECKMEAESAAEEIKRIQIKSNRKISDVNKCFKSHCQKRRSKRYKPQKGVSRCNVIYVPSEDDDRLESGAARTYDDSMNRGNDYCISPSPSPYEDDADYYSVSSSGEDFEPECQSSSNSIEPQKSYLSFGKSCNNYKKKKDGRLFVSFFNIFKI